jgi:hypothetical protein
MNDRRVDPEIDRWRSRESSNMPAYLQRFLAERTDNPGFRYEVRG